MRNKKVNQGITNAIKNKNLYLIKHVQVYDSDDSDIAGANDLEKLTDPAQQLAKLKGAIKQINKMILMLKVDKPVPQREGRILTHGVAIKK